MNTYVLLLGVLLTPAFAHAGLYKCERPNKTVAYSDKPCPTGSQAKTMGTAVTAAKTGEEPSLGEEWRNPYFSETKNDSDWRKASKEAYFKARADFDGDNMEDTALLLVSRNNNESAVVVYLSSQKFRAVPIVKEVGLYALTGRGLKTVSGDVPGEFKVTCAASGGCLQKFPLDTPVSNPSLKLPALAYFQKNDPGNPQLFVWDMEEKRFYSLLKEKKATVGAVISTPSRVY